MKHRAFAGSLAFLGIVYLALTNLQVGSILPIERELAQTALFPLLVLSLFSFGLAGFRIPAAVLLLAVIGAAFSLLHTYVFSLNQAGGIALARLSHDDLQNHTRIFRELINSQAMHSNIGVKSIPSFIESRESAESFLAEHPPLMALIWGGQRWLNVSFQRRPSASLGSLGLGVPYANHQEMKLVQSVPIIGLSLEPIEATASFLANLSEGLSLNIRMPAADSEAREEIALFEAAARRAFWTNAAHRAHPAWLLGNRYLISSLREFGLERQALSCALRSYKSALALLNRGDNSELKAAINNNMAVALYSRYASTGKPKFRKAAQKRLLQALRTLHEPNIFKVMPEASGVAADNLASLLAAKNIKKLSERRSRKGKKEKSKKANKGRGKGTLKTGQGKFAH
ncbi:MAG: hypothetical protein J5J00_11825 [Deltaproteobacteria bacterium]|nr:hypothetical protein [Deltaproteobacteria bacterium]